MRRCAVALGLLVPQDQYATCDKAESKKRANIRKVGERSDIDIGMEGLGPVSIAALAAIHDELEDSPTLYTRARLII